MRKSAKKRDLKRKFVKDLPWHLGFGWIGEFSSENEKWVLV